MADSVGAAQSTGTVNYVGGTQDKTSKGLTVDTETFLKLLVAQLQYQDPLEPQSDTAFVTQLAQMTSLEQMQQMNATLTSAQAYEMIGKYAYAEVLNSKTGVTNCYLGLVQSVLLKSGVPYVMLGDYAVAASNVTRVFDSSYFGSDASDTAAGTETQTNSVTG